MTLNFEQRIMEMLMEIKEDLAQIKEQNKNQDKRYCEIKERLEKHEQRIAALENRPTKWWDKIITIIITGVGATFITWFLNTRN